MRDLTAPRSHARAVGAQPRGVRVPTQHWRGRQRAPALAAWLVCGHPFVSAEIARAELCRHRRPPASSALAGLLSNDSEVAPGATATPRCWRQGGNAYAAPRHQSFPVRCHQRDLLYPPFPASGSPQNAPADSAALGPWIQTCWDVGSALEGGAHGESPGPLERDVPFYREVCPWCWNLLWHPLRFKAVLPSRPSSYCPGVHHAGGGLSLSRGGLHVTHHCD